MNLIRFKGNKCDISLTLEIVDWILVGTRFSSLCSYCIHMYVQNKSFFWISLATCLQVILPLIHIKLCLSENEKDYPIDKHVNSNFTACSKKNDNLAPSVKKNSMCLNMFFTCISISFRWFTWGFSFAHCFSCFISLIWMKI